ncbi:MAG: single-stranded-DNA-specific exonuclease RecJ [Verrucomicrobia bacterium]|nr:single-stranded-DNA-specific exonuclease RecJ [Verrucomicrobiota bacterium]
MQRRWILPPLADAVLTQRLSVELGVPGVVAALLSARGFSTIEEASLFLDPRLATLRPPEDIPGIIQAAGRLQEAVESNERITLYGDYDVDGISSLTILCRFLRQAGASVECFIPDRSREGYGLSSAGVARCLKETLPGLVVAVDCGTNSRAEAEQLRKAGCDLVILDHHEPGEETAAPLSAALVNPKLGNAFHYLCSAGIVFKLCHAMQKAHPVDGIDLRDFLDLVAVGTVADIVPLIGENRIFVRAGLKQLTRSRWAGLHALLHVSGAAAPYDPSDIGFKIGPRINAAGRLGRATEALSLLLTDDANEATRIAAQLDQQNRERQAVERDVTLQVEAWVDAHFDPVRHATIVAGQRDWHQGVVGIVASRISRRWHRPTLIIGFDDAGAGKGSGRSIDGMPLVEALGRCSSLLDTFGGHDMAAGLSLQESQLSALRESFETATRQLISDEDLIPRLRLDIELDLSLANEEWLETQERLSPFGTGNSQPILFSRGVSPSSPPRVLKEKHLKLDLMSKGRRTQAIWFNGAAGELPRTPWDVAYTVNRNTWQGREEAQVQIVAVRSAAA